MASNRHLGRIIALQTLYEYDFRDRLGDESIDLEGILDRNLERYEKKIDDKDFVCKLTVGVNRAGRQLDAMIAPVAPDWPLSQISIIDRDIMRMAVFELTQFAGDIPPKVAINEAVELAKSFSSDSSSRFVNGVLGTIWRKINEERDEQSKQPKQTSSQETK
ncbi:transcription antitermination factor NusB [Candidatus Nanoperiomorbus periodonticus]|uniref:transcription antitermination factor NusB n=1 Tax=Candidatus Nanoperiomorbus periodonticus TaxID=2171989 RepID=UPI00101D625E|nr:transcription antitermination factor NusB [Candidatus Nanoperiomorbus periodonticus]RYC75537.1 N utilization substance protein B [Candidatus Nanoperiomorbus periodonticus]